MHELSTMQGIVSYLLEHIKIKGITRVKEVHLEIGAFTMLSAPQLRFAFKSLVKGSPLEGSELVIAEVSGRACRVTKLRCDGP